MSNINDVIQGYIIVRKYPASAAEINNISLSDFINYMMIADVSKKSP